MKKQHVLSLSLLLAMAFTACQKDNMKNDGISEFGVAFEALNTRFALPVGATKSAEVVSDSVVWDSAHLVVSTIKFEAELKSQATGEDSIEIEYKWHGPEFIDLLNNELTLGNFVLAPGIYDEIELKVEGLKEDAGADPVFYLEGTYKNGSTSLPVAVKVTQSVYFKTEKENVEVTEEGIDITSVIQVYLDELMADVDPADLGNATLTDGVILISAQSNKEIYYTIVRNLAHDRRCHYKHRHHGEKEYRDGYGDKDHDD